MPGVSRNMGSLADQQPLYDKLQRPIISNEIAPSV